jgi:hypothetical protein
MGTLVAALWGPASAAKTAGEILLKAHEPGAAEIQLEFALGFVLLGFFDGFTGALLVALILGVVVGAVGAPPTRS